MAALAGMAVAPTAAGAAARTEAGEVTEAATATAAATAAAAAPVVCLLEEEVGTWGEERAVMAGGAGVVGCAVEAMVGAMAAPTAEAGAKVEVVLTAALTEVVIDDGLR